jgi:hypothetical protein
VTKTQKRKTKMKRPARTELGDGRFLDAVLELVNGVPKLAKGIKERGRGTEI